MLIVAVTQWYIIPKTKEIGFNSFIMVYKNSSNEPFKNNLTNGVSV